MSYAAVDEEAGPFNKFRSELDEVDVKRGPDKFRKGFYEICLTGYNSHTLDDMAESLEENGYRFIDGDPFGLTYCSPDGKIRIDMKDDSVVRSEWSIVTIIRGGLTEDELPVAEVMIDIRFVKDG